MGAPIKGCWLLDTGLYCTPIQAYAKLGISLPERNPKLYETMEALLVHANLIAPHRLGRKSGWVYQRSTNTMGLCLLARLRKIASQKDLSLDMRSVVQTLWSMAVFDKLDTSISAPELLRLVSAPTRLTTPTPLLCSFVLIDFLAFPAFSFFGGGGGACAIAFAPMSQRVRCRSPLQRARGHTAGSRCPRGSKRCACRCPADRRR